MRSNYDEMLMAAPGGPRVADVEEVGRLALAQSLRAPATREIDNVLLPCLTGWIATRMERYSVKRPAGHSFAPTRTAMVL